MFTTAKMLATDLQGFPEQLQMSNCSKWALIAACTLKLTRPEEACQQQNKTRVAGDLRSLYNSEGVTPPAGVFAQKL